MLILTAATLLGIAASSEPSSGATERQIAWLVRGAPRHPMARPERRQTMAALIDEAADRYRLRRALVVAIVYRESSIRPRKIGPNGELGLMQVYPETARDARCRDMATPAGQLDCGCRVLRLQTNRCGSLRGGFAAYASRGRCRAIEGSKLAWVVEDRFGLAARLEEVARER